MMSAGELTLPISSSSSSSGSNSGPPVAMTRQHEAELIKRITQDRDKVAFQNLLEEHKSAMYSLAMMLMGDSNRAEDAVQEAAIRIWRFSHTFKPTGSLRSWLLTIVGRECLRIQYRKPKKELAMNSEELDIQSGLARSENMEEASQRSEQNELIEILRNALMTLSEAERQIMALAYGTEMSHAEIGYAIALPRRSVSKKIAAIIVKLRNVFKSRGQVALLPLLTPNLLGNAICGGALAPASLAEKVVAGAMLAGKGAGYVAPFGVKTGGVKFATVVGLLLMLAGVGVFTTFITAPASGSGPAGWGRGNGNSNGTGGTFLAAAQPENGLVPSQEPTVTPTDTPAEKAPATGAVPTLYYDFSKGIPPGLVFTGQPHWLPPVGNKPGRLVITMQANQFEGIVFPAVQLDERPLKMTIRLWIAGRTGGLSLQRLRGRTIPAQTHRVNRSPTRIVPMGLCSMEYYIFQNYSISSFRRENELILWSIQRYDSFLPGDRVVLGINRLEVCDITIEIVDEKDLPANVQNVNETWNTFIQVGSLGDQVLRRLFTTDPKTNPNAKANTKPGTTTEINPDTKP